MNNNQGLSQRKEQSMRLKTSISSQIKVNSSYAKIYDAYIQNPPIKTMSSNKELSGVIDALGKWRFFLGIKDKASKEEIIVNTQFIREHFGELNVQDLHEAMGLSIAGKFEVDNNHYGNFGPLYISRILRAYITYRNSALNWCKNELRKNTKPAENVISEEEHLEEMRKFFLRMHDTANSEGFVNDYGDVWYNFAKRNGFINFTDDLIERARVFGVEKSQSDAHEGILLKLEMRQQMSHQQKEHKRRSYSRSYVVSEWLKDIAEPESFAQNITKEMLK
jgi:hypothetical protein